LAESNRDVDFFSTAAVEVYKSTENKRTQAIKAISENSFFISCVCKTHYAWPVVQPRNIEITMFINDLFQTPISCTCLPSSILHPNAHCMPEE